MENNGYDRNESIVGPFHTPRGQKTQPFECQDKFGMVRQLTVSPSVRLQ